jgi:hypothetical protein
VIDESDLQFEKHFDSRISTFLGIKIDLSDENENAVDSIRVNREFNSKTTNFNELPSLPKLNGSVNRYRFRKVIEDGIQTHRISVLDSVQRVSAHLREWDENATIGQWKPFHIWMEMEVSISVPAECEI